MTADPDARGRPLRPTTAGVAALTTAILWALALATPAALQRFALARRVAGSPVLVTSGSARPVTAADGRAVLEEWRRIGVAGRTVLHVGAFLHSVPPDGLARTTAPLQAKAGVAAALRDAIRRSASDRSYLWAAVELGVARRIVFVEPRASLIARAEELELPAPAPGEPLDLGIRGLERVAYDRVPPLREPVLLDVAASWFEGEDPDSLRVALAAAGIRADVVTLNRMAADATVSSAARERLDAFGAGLSSDGATERAR